mgnify:CR=1 FL=1
MHTVDATEAVWQRLIEVRDSQGCLCCGTWSEGESAALALYGMLARRDGGLVTLGQIGQSLDGRVATESGDTRDVSGPDGLVHLHRLRALADGVVIGVRTALIDSPRLTVRLCEGDNPARIVIDPAGRLDDASAVLDDDGARRIVIQATKRARPDGVEVIHVPAREGLINPAEILSELHDRNLSHLLIEGGSLTLSRFLEKGLLDALHVAIAPVLIGGGPQGLTMPHVPETLAEAIRPTAEVYSLGSDVVFDCRFGVNESVPGGPVVHSSLDTRDV